METRTAIVTGGSRGLGRAVSELLASNGWLVVTDARYAPAQPLAPGVVLLTGDVTDPDHRTSLVAEARRRSGRIDLLMNNAGGLGPSPLPALAEFPLADLAELFVTNVEAPLALVQAALPLLRACGGAVVNVTSDAAVEAYPGWGGYGASKAALEQIGAVLAVEEPGVRFWTFDPGDMRTAMHQAAFPGEDISDRPGPETVAPAVLRLVEELPPSGRVGAAELLVGDRS